MFDGVGSALNLQDIKVVGSEGWGTEMIYVLDENGLITEECYTWNCPDNGYDTWCWADANGAVADVELTSGTGFYLYADSDGLAMQCSGQVKVGEYSKNLIAGYNITGNFSPVDLDIQDLTIENSEGWGTEMIYVLDENGLLTDDCYTWNCPDNGYDTWCWADADGAVAEKTVKAGEGLYLYADSEGLVLKLPAVIAK